MHLIKYLLKLPSDPDACESIVGHDDRATRSAPSSGHDVHVGC